MATEVDPNKMQFAAFNGPSSTPSPIDAKVSRLSFTQTELYPILSKISLPRQRGGSGKNTFGSIRLPILDNPLYAQKSRKNLLREPSYSQFCPKFRCHGNGGRSGKMQLAAFDGASPKTPYRRKHLAKISYASRVIAHFVSNFVAMATRESPG